jgi:hypothetical protein
VSEAKNKKLLEQFTAKSKDDVERVRRQHDDDLKRVEDDYYAKIEAKQKRIA